jgi:hypothetical protein
VTGTNEGVGYGDLNNDGLLDVITWSSTEVSLRRARGDGTFDSPTVLDSGTGLWGVTVADLDNDGNLFSAPQQQNQNNLL